MPVLALKAFARRTALVLARFANRRAVRWPGYGFDRRIGAGFAEIIVAVAPSASMALAAGAVIGLSGGHRRLRAFLRALLRAILGTVLRAMAVAIMPRPAIFRSAAGPPHIHHFQRRDGIGRRYRRTGIHRSYIAGCSRLDAGFGSRLRLRRFPRLGFR